MRLLPVAVLVLLLLCSSAAGATAPRFFAPPGHVFQGQRVTFKLFGASGAKSCTLRIHYTGGRLQRLASKPVVGGSVSWTVRIPNAKPGPATLAASCGTLAAKARLTVRAALEAPKLEVTKRGFSQRPHQYDAGSDFNFGIAVHNERSGSDATNVAILVNAVDATNRVLGSAHLYALRLPAAETVYLGGQIVLPTQTAATRVETVFVDATSSEHAPSLPLLVSDPVLTSDAKGFLTSVRGQLLNHYPRDMQAVTVGVLLEDAAGNVVGGGTAYVQGPLSLGAREAFQLLGPFNAIPDSSGLQAVFTTVPTYATQ